MRFASVFLMKPTVSIIIAAYNEGQTIRNVLAAATEWNKAKEIIVVNDGSTDNTLEVVRSFRPRVRILHVRKNKGKGNALACGVKAVTSDIVFFADADIVGLTAQNIEELMVPVREGKADMVIGLHNFWGIGSFRPYNSLSGQRVLWRNRLLRHFSHMTSAAGGVEIVINTIHRGLRIAYIEQRNVTTLRKVDKWPAPFAWWAYLRQAVGFIKGYRIKKSVL